MTSHASRKNSAPGEVFEFYKQMRYAKTPLSISQQIDKLIERGLIIDDREIAASYLSNISYYRLRAYTYPFQDNENLEEDHHFIDEKIHFSDIIDLYCFDRRLRSLIFNAIEKIEVSVRTKIVQIYSEHTGDSHWFLDEKLYKVFYNDEDVSKYTLLMRDIKNEISRSNEDFIKHYIDRYEDPELPPAWMTLEVLSFGTLSKLYKLLLKSEQKQETAKYFGLSNSLVLENWLHAFSVLRNSCAHHSRIWNRRFIIQLILPHNTVSPFMDKDTIKKTRNNKIFALLSCIKYISDIISPTNGFKDNFMSISSQGGNLLNYEDMGFPPDWETLHVWRNK